MSDSLKTYIHCYISGIVQGVCYRAYTRQQAINFGLTGWVKNLPDGRVEVLMYGEPDKINLCLEKLRIGPPNAKVTKLITACLEDDQIAQVFTNFEIIY